MKLSTKARYGLRAMMALAVFPDGAAGKVIAESRGLPTAYLEQLLARLRNAQLVVAVRGARGKYMLVRPPETVTLADIIEALEGPIEIAQCSDVPNCSEDPDLCAIRNVFADASRALRSHLADITLADLVERQRVMESASGRMFHI